MKQDKVKELVAMEIKGKHIENMDNFYNGNMGEEDLVKLKEKKAIIDNAEDMCISIIDKYVPI